MIACEAVDPCPTPAQIAWVIEQSVDDAAHADPPKPVVTPTTLPKTLKTSWGWVHANTYFGKWFDPSAEVTRECVVARESMDHRDAYNSSGASGYYQFMLPWTHTIQQWTGEHVPIRDMSTQAQDLAWWRAWDFGKGASNWAGGRWSCPGT
jgi:hypothetical protein